jgi:2-keto-3-deoxy-L-rhamnonate aldolase RhmA
VVLQILDAGREPVAQQMAKTEHMIRRASGVGVVLDDTQIGLVGVMVQTVEHARRFAHRCRNEPRVERSIMAGHVRAENRAGVDAVFGIDGTAHARTASGFETLAAGLSESERDALTGLLGIPGDA